MRRRSCLYIFKRKHRASSFFNCCCHCCGKKVREFVNLSIDLSLHIGNSLLGEPCPVLLMSAHDWKYFQSCFILLSQPYKICFIYNHLTFLIVSRVKMISEWLVLVQYLQGFETPVLFSHLFRAEKRAGVSKPCKNRADPRHSSIDFPVVKKACENSQTPLIVFKYPTHRINRYIKIKFCNVLHFSIVLL